MSDCATLPGQSVRLADCPFFLSSRQQQTLSLAAHGWTDFRISRELRISPRTVRHHLEAARQNLHAINTTHAVAVAITFGLIGLEGGRE